jgi:hypothetical protein
MIANGWIGWAVTLLLLPTLVLMIDAVGVLRARHAPTVATETVCNEDFSVLVPIYGSMRYLENAEYLATYGERVVLCTTNAESPEFYTELKAVALRYGFRVFCGDALVSSSHGQRRSTGGTARDRLIRAVLSTVTTTYVVCVDADTVTRRPLSELVGAIAAQGLQLASICLVPSNTARVLGRLQAHEYRLSMRMRVIAPWLVSGACHAGETAALREVMSHHSLFFQGNDVETGVLADAMQFRVGHVPFEVPTVVPDRIWPWWRQRLAWSGGEFRLFFVNIAIGRFHPFLWFYGLVIGMLALPLRWDALIMPEYVLITVVALYLLLHFYIHGEPRDRWLLLMPLYSAVISLVLTPLGVVSYFQMAISGRNWGIIHPPARGQARSSDPSLSSTSPLR